VLISNYQGARLAVGHLLELGHRRIACITGPSRLTLRGERLKGFEDGLAEAGIALPDSYVLEGDFAPESGHMQGLKLLSLDNRPTAIFAFNDLMAFGVLRAARETGVRVPEELSVVGFDDIYLASFSTPPLTTIRLPIHEMGKEAMQMLLERIENGDALPNQQHLEVELIVRESTAASRS
jgi:DNA-binding LacI/PurR family transcriptional regulator